MSSIMRLAMSFSALALATPAAAQTRPTAPETTGTLQARLAPRLTASVPPRAARGLPDGFSLSGGGRMLEMTPFRALGLRFIAGERRMDAVAAPAAPRGGSAPISLSPAAHAAGALAAIGWAASIGRRATLGVDTGLAMTRMSADRGLPGMTGMRMGALTSLRLGMRF